MERIESVEQEHSDDRKRKEEKRSDGKEKDSRPDQW